MTWPDVAGADVSERDWVRYWRSGSRSLEVMHARFTRHTYHRHSHETYSFGVTEDGAQSFTCRGAAHTSAAGMVMAFNPDDPHDGHAATELGFRYRIVHIGAEVVADVLTDRLDRPTRLPLFAQPVLYDHALAEALRGLHVALVTGDELRQDELLTSTVAALVDQAATQGLGSDRTPALTEHGARRLADRVRDLLDAAYPATLTADDLSAHLGCSRYAVYRAFHRTYGMAPSDYQRQLRLRAARRLLVQGCAPAEVAAQVGFADQAHLTRWFTRYYGITPGRFGRAACPGDRTTVARR